MVVRLRFWWQKIRQHLMTAVVIMVASMLGIALIAVIILGYWLNWYWTGFNGGESKITVTSTSKGTTTATELQPAKNLWDWLQPLGILAIPVVVGVGTVWFTTKQGQVSDATNKDNQRESALQTYIDNMSELLLQGKLRDSEEDEVRKIARVRTLTVLRRLDAARKASLLQFLHEAGLIDKNNRIIDLSEADLFEAKLFGANLRGADLREVTLRGADLSHANLLYTNLRGVDLSYAKLFGAKLFGANLREANLREADLRGATVTKEQLEKAKSLKGTTMPDGSIHP